MLLHLRRNLPIRRLEFIDDSPSGPVHPATEGKPKTARQMAGQLGNSQICSETIVASYAASTELSGRSISQISPLVAKSRRISGKVALSSELPNP